MSQLARMHLPGREQGTGAREYPGRHKGIPGKPEEAWGSHPSVDQRGNCRGDRLSRLPRVSGKSLVAALAKLGYELDHQTGSHMILRHRSPPYRRVTVPNHKEIAKG